MRQKGIVFTTSLSLRDCGNLFRTTGESVRGKGARLLEVTAKVAGNSDRTGFYTPTFNSPFSQIDGTPDFAIGLNILKFNAGAQGNGTHVHMYVDDNGGHRTVELVSSHGMLDAARSAKFVRRFFEEFQGADPKLQVAETNI
jgi:hypothetical protein